MVAQVRGLDPGMRLPPLGYFDRARMDKVPTWAKRFQPRGQSPGNLTRMRVEFFGIAVAHYPEMLAAAVFELELLVEAGDLLH